KSRRGVNVPGVKLNIPFLSKKDKQDILFAIEQNYDYIAASREKWSFLNVKCYLYVCIEDLFIFFISHLLHLHSLQQENPRKV
ncbi:MAG: pyruvate kinase, partial [Candidatus Phytoplasma australasiaticum]|nr:pyruvate kinase [Candidatus Phytoplasma australasiaticum]